MAIMKTLNGYEVYDSKARGYITPVTTSGTGDAYVATVEGIESLEIGASFIMIPHTTSTTDTPTLNVNGLGVKGIRQRISTGSGTTAEGSINGWLRENMPVRVTWDGLRWVAEVSRPDANHLYGTVPISSGGTGGTTASEARANLEITLNNIGITWGTDEPPESGASKANTIYIQII